MLLMPDLSAQPNRRSWAHYCHSTEGIIVMDHKSLCRSSHIHRHLYLHTVAPAVGEVHHRAVHSFDWLLHSSPNRHTDAHRCSHCHCRYHHLQPTDQEWECMFQCHSSHFRRHRNRCIALTLIFCCLTGQ